MAHPDLDELLNTLLPFAQQMLAKQGEFLPFAAQMNASGEVQLVAGYAEDEHPPSQDVIDLIAKGLRERARVAEIRASGICYDVRIHLDGEPAPTDAICVSLDRAESGPIDVYLPYAMGPSASPEYGEIRAGGGSLQIFPT